jgi:hypothetical protein
MASVNMEYEIEKRSITALRAVFEIDDTFRYNKVEEQTQLLINSEYPEKNTAIKVPRLIITGITLSVNCVNTLGGNFYRDILVDGKMGQEYANIIPYTANLICLATLYESKDLANKTLNYISFEYNEVFDAVGLKIINVTKGATVPQNQYPEKIFETPVMVQGQIDWTGVKIPNYQKIKMISDLKSQLELK